MCYNKTDRKQCFKLMPQCSSGLHCSVSLAVLVGSCFTDVQESSSPRRTSGKAVREEYKR
jgi:hypothetical protein